MGWSVAARVEAVAHFVRYRLLIDVTARRKRSQTLLGDVVSRPRRTWPIVLFPCMGQKIAAPLKPEVKPLKLLARKTADARKPHGRYQCTGRVVLMRTAVESALRDG